MSKANEQEKQDAIKALLNAVKVAGEHGVMGSADQRHRLAEAARNFAIAAAILEGTLPSDMAKAIIR